MIWLPDATVDHLRAIAAWPEFTSDRYEVLDEIGRGGMGTVYAAFDHVLEREVAIKIGNALPSSELQERLTREARVIARLEHPGIVPVHDVGMLADGRPFYVMKRVHGRTLQACIDAAEPVPERLRIFERVCEAVAFAHAHGIIHRDLKPANVMVGTFGEAMVMDWGVARVLDGVPIASSSGDRTIAVAAQHSATDAGTVLGTPGFMPPEQVQNRGDVDERADVYALGAMLFAVLTGHAPPQGPAAALREIECARTVPPPLQSICRCALSPGPDDRYQTVAALAADVARYRERLAVTVHKERATERLARFVRTYQTPILLVLAYVAMRVAIAIFAGF